MQLSSKITAKNFWILTFVLAVIGNILLGVGINNANNSNGKNVDYLSEGFKTIMAAGLIGFFTWVYCLANYKKGIIAYFFVGLFLCVILPNIVTGYGLKVNVA